MSGVTDFLFGSQPSTSQQPSIAPQQSGILDQLANLLKNGGTPPGVKPLQGPFAAPLQPLQLTSLQGLQNLANNTSGTTTQGQNQIVDSSQNSLLNLLNKGAPQIDASSVIQNSVVNPLMKQFNDQILPSIIGKYAGSAGGTFGSDAMKARAQAGSDLEGNIANEAGQLGFSAAQSNQNANLQGLNLGLGAAGNIAGLPTALDQGNSNLLSSLLNAGGVPYNVAQLGVQGQQNAQLNQQQQTQAFLQDMIAAFSPGTMNTVVNPGSAGLLPSLISGLGSNSGFGSSFGQYLFG